MASVQDRRPAPDLKINLASNNPFRRTASPANASPSHLTPTTPTLDSQGQKRVSTNPFLDTFEAPAVSSQPAQPPVPTLSPPVQQQPPPPAYSRSPPRQPQPQGAPMPFNRMPFTRKPVGESKAPQASTTELMNGLQINDRPTNDRNDRQQRNAPRVGPPQSMSNHRPTLSGEQELLPRPDRRARPTREQNPFGSPEGAENLRPTRTRRNSESSVAEFKDDARRRQDRERRHRERDGKTRDGKSKKPRPSRQMDLIDKLDVSSIYGTGLFHHDGPFDACNPHRNRNGLKQTPMSAFPQGSANNALGGGKVAKNMDYDKFHGREAEGWSDYNATLARNTSKQALWSRPRADQIRNEESFDPKGRDLVYGEETAGLGASTFLEGTPAPRTAVQRQDVAKTDDFIGLQRKKSISQKIARTISRPRKRTLENGQGVTSPEAQYQVVYEDGRPISPGSPEEVQSAGGRGKIIEMNPFFTEQPVPGSASVGDQKSAGNAQVTETITEAPPEIPRPRTASSPNRGLARKTTNEAGDVDGNKSNGVGSGLLTRMKSLKGGKRTRPDRSGSGSNAA